MHLSRYLRVVPEPGGAGTCLVFSTRRGSLVRLPAALLERLAAGEADLPPDTAHTLQRLAILAEDHGAERREVLAFLDQVNRASPVVTAAVVLGTACNFACPYCYQRDLPAVGAMDAATAAALVSFLAARLGPGKERLEVDFYGGEPLLYLDRLADISCALQEAARGRGSGYRFTLVTNGSLLTSEVVDRLQPLGLAGVKVTLDGPPAVHDRCRPARGGGATFGGIVANLQGVCEHVPVAVQGNFTPATWRRFPELLEILRTAGLGPERIQRIHLAPVQETGAIHRAETDCGGHRAPWFAEAAVVLRGEVLRRGYEVARLAPSPCMVELDDALTVNWDGTLTQCPALAGRPGFAVGDVGQGLRDYRDRFAVGHWGRHAACRDCTVLPLCFGGCRWAALERSGRIDALDCRREFLDTCLDSFILQDAARLAPTVTPDGAAPPLPSA